MKTTFGRCEAAGTLNQRSDQYGTEEGVADLDQHLLFKDTILDMEGIYDSGNQFLNDFAAELAQLLVPAGVVVGQLVVV